MNFKNKTVALASTSQIKYSAASLAFPEAKVSKNNVKSGVDEQPFNSNTIDGVFGRLHNLKAGAAAINFYDLITDTLHTLKANVSTSNFYIAIESGIFTSDMTDNKIIPAIAKGRYFDYAIIGIMNVRDEIIISASEGVEFPADCVEEAQKLGFDKWTAGMVMEKKGLVTDHKDPHASLSSKERKQFLLEALKKMQEHNQGFFQ